jgi:SUMO ligase MMS21 Smc5/6 complex component
MASRATASLATAQERVAHRVASRERNERLARDARLATDEQALVEFACECTNVGCERSVKVPLYVYRRLLEGRNQYLLQAGHHAFTSYRTIVATGLMRIEERV